MQKPEKMKDVGNARLLRLRMQPGGDLFADFDRPVVVCDHENDLVLYDASGTMMRGDALSFTQASPTSLHMTVTNGYSSSVLFLFIPEGTRTLRPLEGGRVMAGLGRSRCRRLEWRGWRPVSSASVTGLVTLAGIMRLAALLERTRR